MAWGVRNLISTQVDARAQGASSPSFRLTKFAGQGVAGKNAIHVGPDGASDASKDAEPASTISAEALFYRGW